MVLLDMVYRARKYSSGDIFCSRSADFLADTALFLNKYASGDIIVAHFDHGIRRDSANDTEFVRQKTKDYGLSFETRRVELGEKTSEAAARAARYDFLHEVAEKYTQDGVVAEIWTAHHLDDLMETIAINLLRGTGWRGLAGLDMAGIRRPFLEMLSGSDSRLPWDKTDIMRYAAERHLSWREDSTNSSDEYLRNRLRENLALSRAEKLEIFQLWNSQKNLRNEIDQLVRELLPPENKSWHRAWFKDLDADIALELLRAGTLQARISATRPQLENFRKAILSYAPKKKFNLPGDRLVKLEKDSFRLLNKK